MIVALYIICGILAYGFSYASFRALGDHDKFSDKMISMILMITGFYGLFSILVLGGCKHGIKFRG